MVAMLFVTDGFDALRVLRVVTRRVGANEFPQKLFAVSARDIPVVRDGGICSLLRW